MIPKKYRKTPEGAIASYDWIDIANGLGYEIFYGALTKTHSGTGYILTPNVLFSDTLDTVVDGGAVLTKVLDRDYDATAFAIPRTIKGTLYISTAWQGINNGADGITGYHIFRIRKWDGTTETEIASVQSESISSAPAFWKVSLLSVSLPRTHFKVGETLRITQEFWTIQDGEFGTHNIYLYHDPKNRAAAGMDTTTLRFDIPFQIETD